MKVALFVKDDRTTTPDLRAVKVLVFSMENEIVTGMEECYLFSLNVNYVSLWMLNKQINVVYIPEEQPAATVYFRKINVLVKTYDEIDIHSELRNYLT